MSEALIAAVRRVVARQGNARTSITITRVVGEHVDAAGEVVPETVVVTAEPLDDDEEGPRARLRVLPLLLLALVAAVAVAAWWRVLRWHR
jgi:hypothetical protein